MTILGSGSSPFERFAASMRRSVQPEMSMKLNGFGAQIAKMMQPQISRSLARTITPETSASLKLNGLGAQIAKAMQPQISGTLPRGLASANSSFLRGISPTGTRPLLTGMTPEMSVKLNGLGAQIAKMMQPQISGTLPRGLTLTGHTFFPEDKLPRLVDVLLQLAEESRRRLAEFEPGVRWLDPDAEARPERWVDPSPVVAVAVGVLRLLGVAESPAESVDEARTMLPASPSRAMLAMPVQEQAELDEHVDLPLAMVEESLARLWRWMTDIVAELLLMVVVVFVVRILARARTVVPRLWDAVLFMLVVLVACRRSGARSDDPPHLSSLLIRRRQPSAGRVPAAC